MSERDTFLDGSIKYRWGVLECDPSTESAGVSGLECGKAEGPREGDTEISEG